MFASCHPVELVLSLFPSRDIICGKLCSVLQLAMRPTQLLNTQLAQIWQAHLAFIKRDKGVSPVFQLLLEVHGQEVDDLCIPSGRS